MRFAPLPRSVRSPPAATSASAHPSVLALATHTQAAEARGHVVRDDSLAGLRWYANRFAELADGGASGELGAATAAHGAG